MIWLRVVFALAAPAAAARGSTCDTTTRRVREGNVGETAVFPWLGLLRVHLHEGDSYKVALTGLVLVQEGYALANADDVARIPKRIFKEDSRGMFIPREGEAWYCALVDYVTHPEYEYATMNTIALVQLDPGPSKVFPMKPICWPPYSYNITRDLHAIAFTDGKNLLYQDGVLDLDNKLLEKSIFAMKHVSQKNCDQFYKKAGLMDRSLMPTHPLCGFAARNKENCIWDNGVVMASNTTNYWALVGFGIRGPGCAAPARFINILPFLPWIESVTNFQDGNSDPHFRRSAFNEGFKETLRGPKSDPNSNVVGGTPNMSLSFQNKYPFDTSNVHSAYFSIDRIDERAIQIRNVRLPAEDGECSNKTKRLLYRDKTKVFIEEEGFISYRLSMYDLMAYNYTCAVISIEPATCDDKASLYWMSLIENTEGLSFHQFGDTPEPILQVFPVKKIALRPDPNAYVNPGDWTAGPNLKVSMLTDDDEPLINITNFNIYLKFAFEDRGVINVEIYGPLKPPPINRTTTTSTTTEEWKRARAQESEDEELEEVETVVAEPDDGDSTTARAVKPDDGDSTTARAEPEVLEPLPVVREPAPTSTKLLKETTLFSAGDKQATYSLKVIAVQVLTVLSLY